MKTLKKGDLVRVLSKDFIEKLCEYKKSNLYSLTIIESGYSCYFTDELIDKFGGKIVQIQEVFFNNEGRKHPSYKIMEDGGKYFWEDYMFEDQEKISLIKNNTSDFCNSCLLKEENKDCKDCPLNSINSRNAIKVIVGDEFELDNSYEEIYKDIDIYSSTLAMTEGMKDFSKSNVLKVEKICHDRRDFSYIQIQGSSYMWNIHMFKDKFLNYSIILKAYENYCRRFCIFFNKCDNCKLKCNIEILKK